MEEAAVIWAKNAIVASTVPKKIKKMIAKPEFIFFALLGSDKQTVIENFSAQYADDEFRAYIITQSRRIVLFLLYEEFYTVERLSELLGIELVALAKVLLVDAPFEIPANMIDIAGQVVNDFIRDTIVWASSDADIVNGEVGFSSLKLFSRFNKLFKISGTPVVKGSMILMSDRMPEYRKPNKATKRDAKKNARISAYNTLYTALVREVGTQYPTAPTYPAKNPETARDETILQFATEAARMLMRATPYFVAFKWASASSTLEHNGQAIVTVVDEVFGDITFVLYGGIRFGLRYTEDITASPALAAYIASYDNGTIDVDYPIVQELEDRHAEILDSKPMKDFLLKFDMSTLESQAFQPNVLQLCVRATNALVALYGDDVLEPVKKITTAIVTQDPQAASILRRETAKVAFRVAINETPPSAFSHPADALSRASQAIADLGSPVPSFVYQSTLLAEDNPTVVYYDTIVYVIPRGFVTPVFLMDSVTVIDQWDSEERTLSDVIASVGELYMIHERHTGVYPHRGAQRFIEQETAKIGLPVRICAERFPRIPAYTWKRQAELKAAWSDFATFYNTLANYN